MKARDFRRSSEVSLSPLWNLVKKFLHIFSTPTPSSLFTPQRCVHSSSPRLHAFRFSHLFTAPRPIISIFFTYPTVKVKFRSSRTFSPPPPLSKLFKPQRCLRSSSPRLYALWFSHLFTVPRPIISLFSPSPTFYSHLPLLFLHSFPSLEVLTFSFFMVFLHFSSSWLPSFCHFHSSHVTTRFL